MLNTKSNRVLSRKRDQRRALIKNLATQLILHEKIVTTRANGKEVLPYLERLIEISKKPTLANMRRLIALTDTHEAAQKLYRDLGKRFAKRSGGYISLKLAGWRKGDDARLVTMALTEAKGAAAPAKEPAKVKS